jgi:teichuronic acid biosynthesis glycosyltransferase TuaG
MVDRMVEHAPFIRQNVCSFGYVYLVLSLLHVFRRVEMEPKVSIIIPFYNCSYVDQAIQSALNQTYPNIEIIVVDDGSTKYTEKLQPFQGEFYYLKKENGGTATALNLGISVASGEYIAWLSSDDYFLPDKISHQIAFIQKHNAKACFTNYDYVDKNNNILISWTCPRFSNVREVYEAFLRLNPVNGCSVVIKKDIFDHIGYFNPDMRYTHDYDMWFRMFLNGYPIHYLDEVLLKFRSHEEAGTKKYQPQIKEEISILNNKYRPLLREYINDNL